MCAAADTNQNGHSHESKPVPKFAKYQMRLLKFKVFVRSRFSMDNIELTSTYAHILYSKQCLYFDRTVIFFILPFYNFRVTFWGYDHVAFVFILSE